MLYMHFTKKKNWISTQRASYASSMYFKVGQMGFGAILVDIVVGDSFIVFFCLGATVDCVDCLFD